MHLAVEVEANALTEEKNSGSRWTVSRSKSMPR